MIKDPISTDTSGNNWIIKLMKYIESASFLIMSHKHEIQTSNYAHFQIQILIAYVIVTSLSTWPNTVTDWLIQDFAMPMF